MTTTLTLTIPAASMHAEMGYDAPTGRTIGWVHSYDAEGDPTRIVDFRSVDDEFVEYDGIGRMAPAASLYDEPLQYASLVQTTPYNALVGPPLSGNDCPENKPNCGPPLEQSKNLLGARIVDGTSARETPGSSTQVPAQAPTDQPSIAELERAYGAKATFSRLGNGHVSVRRVLSGPAAATAAVDLGSSLTRTDGSAAPYTVTEEYRPDRGRWVRHSVVTERDATIDGRRAHSVTRLTYRNVQWRANPVQDSLRALRRRAGAAPSAPGLRARVVAAVQRGPAATPSPASPPRASGTLASVATPSRNTAANLIPWLRYCGPPICFIGSPPPVPPPPPPPGYYGYPDPPGGYEIVADPGPVVVFQHGFVSNYTTWDQLAPYIRQQFGVQTERFSTDWGASYSDQADELIRDLATTVSESRPLYLIGHSNGGAISRLAARWSFYNVRAIVAIGTPHLGAPAAAYGASIANVIVGLGTQFHVCADATMCTIASELDKGWQTIARPARRSQPVMHDMTPGTLVHTYLDAPEPVTHFGIQTSIWARHRPFALARDLGGSISAFGGGFAGPCPDPESACGGRAFAQAVERAEARYRTCAVINNIWTVFKALQCQGYIAFIEGADSYHQRVTAGSEIDQDGVVPLSSQLYPYTAQANQYTIYQSVTHAGQTRSLAVREAVDAILRGRLGVPGR